MALRFNRVASPCRIWKYGTRAATAFSFVISYETRTGSGFREKLGYVLRGARSLSTRAPYELAALPSMRSLRPKKPAKSCWEPIRGMTFLLL
jgi:hypothetical protein